MWARVRFVLHLTVCARQMGVMTGKIARPKKRKVLSTVRIYPEDIELISRLQAYTGISSRSQLLRASLRAYQREIDRAEAAAPPPFVISKAG